jgi:predicted ATPase
VVALEDAFSHNEALTLRRVELGPLSEGDERQLARSFLGDQAPEEVVEAVRKAVEGNPLFLEERLSSLVETGAVFRDELVWRLDPNVRAEVPEALERLIRSRVDRLGALAHDAVVAASVLGVEFGLSALRAVLISTASSRTWSQSCAQPACSPRCLDRPSACTGSDMP